ncbi:MAG TPA: hypothetical protein RMH85_28790 [Polyangiaceae bacterium LLY-WYZ-15_(1-7)]|nr:hypothetical protein [Myxococcales bacterium]MAT27227.1 hypothetical protein [Sandaracinus sp.]HJK90174.1 hypothetical protein [Polyangiaceae bacterium LLY-WYZ-15_(1-7)]HJL05522.1 hypothetical protein [Polyangiaceae bacterium LLY-WYZ-15_(1-7)]HJL12512.1 hypothetical protein [Polyangiaceae bacterium LLY-WYZ-15_(1-7)]
MNLAEFWGVYGDVLLVVFAVLAVVGTVTWWAERRRCRCPSCRKTGRVKHWSEKARSEREVAGFAPSGRFGPRRVHEATYLANLACDCGHEWTRKETGSTEVGLFEVFEGRQVAEDSASFFVRRGITLKNVIPHE